MRRLRLGMLTPSSNTVLEPATSRLLANMEGVTAHFSRFEVRTIALDAAGLAQFDEEPILGAARLLSHARCDVIAWNGTSASWLGFERDEALVARLEAETGARAATCVLGFRAIFARLGIRRVGLVTPYTTDVQQRIVANWSRVGFTTVAERHCGIADNFSFAEVSEREIETMVRAVAAEGCDAVAIVCTNMNGMAVAPRLAAELRVPVLDSVAVTLWASLEAAGDGDRAARVLALP
jgi:maleate isomerase